ncbi:hypothetical protein AAC387_Pa01g2180 [Persea americana]
MDFVHRKSDFWKITRAQVDPGSALNHITITALQELGVPPNKLTSTNTAIQGYEDAKPFKGKEVYFPDAAMYEKRRSGVKKPTMETNTAESFKAISQWQKEKLAVRLTDKPKPFKVKVKPVMEKNKPLIISTKSSKSVNVASPEDCLHQGVRWSDLSWALTANGQVPRDCSGIGYHESKIYSLASQRIYGLMMGKIENYR